MSLLSALRGTCIRLRSDAQNDRILGLLIANESNRMARELTDSYSDVPAHYGTLSIAPTLLNGQVVKVTIMGDSDGMDYLSDLLKYMAELDVELRNMPDGARAHFPLRPGLQLHELSCEVEICRAEAKGSGELPF